jgi:RHS repeat-associated protein
VPVRYVSIPALEPGPRPRNEAIASHDSYASLLKVGFRYSTLDYAFDAAGRRTKVWAGFARVTLPAATTANATYDAANELKTWNGTNLTYDQNGNLATNGTQTYTFDERNQLTATSGGASTFKYDGLGRRYEKTVSGTTTRNLYDGPNVVQELNASNAVTANSITGFAPDQVFWRNSGGVNKNVLTDALGSTLATYNSNATPGLQNKFTYDPYGTPDSTAFPYLFAGTNYDSATGLQYNRARYYAPGVNRFASEDPIGILGGSANGYMYGADEPRALTDAFGLLPGPVQQWVNYFAQVLVDAAVVVLTLIAVGEFPFLGPLAVTLGAVYIATWLSGISLTMTIGNAISGREGATAVFVGLLSFVAVATALAFFPASIALYVALGASLGVLTFDTVTGATRLAEQG